MVDAIAQRVLICVKPTGERVTVTLRIGRPYRASDVDWACQVEADGLHANLSDMHGVDSFQALILAQQLLFQLTMGVIKDGGSFRNVEDESIVDVARLFANGARRSTGRPPACFSPHGGRRLR
jgi:hypothetical protein